MHRRDPGGVVVDLDLHVRHVAEFFSDFLQVIRSRRVPEVGAELVRATDESYTLREGVDGDLVAGAHQPACGSLSQLVRVVHLARLHPPACAARP